MNLIKLYIFSDKENKFYITNKDDLLNFKTMKCQYGHNLNNIYSIFSFRFTNGVPEANNYFDFFYKEDNFDPNNNFVPNHAIFNNENYEIVEAYRKYKESIEKTNAHD